MNDSYAPSLDGSSVAEMGFPFNPTMGMGDANEDHFDDLGPQDYRSSRRNRGMNNRMRSRRRGNRHRTYAESDLSDSSLPSVVVRHQVRSRLQGDDASSISGQSSYFGSNDSRIPPPHTNSAYKSMAFSAPKVLLPVHGPGALSAMELSGTRSVQNTLLQIDTEDVAQPALFYDGGSKTLSQEGRGKHFPTY